MKLDSFYTLVTNDEENNHMHPILLRIVEMLKQSNEVAGKISNEHVLFLNFTS